RFASVQPTKSPEVRTLTKRRRVSRTSRRSPCATVPTTGDFEARSFRRLRFAGPAYATPVARGRGGRDAQETRKTISSTSALISLCLNRLPVPKECHKPGKSARHSRRITKDRSPAARTGGNKTLSSCRPSFVLHVATFRLLSRFRCVRRRNCLDSGREY